MSDQRPPKGGWAPGLYECRCKTCAKRFIGEKRAYSCADCAYAGSPTPEVSNFDALVVNALLERTATELARGWVLYELLRVVSVAQYKQLVRDNVKRKGRFDDLVAELAEETK